MEMYDIVVVGAGPAGLSAALYAKRYGMNVVVIDKGTIGGQLSSAAEIENYPGIPRMSGMEWSEKTMSHLKRLNVPIILDTVEDIVKDGEGFLLHLLSGGVVRSLGVIIATGSRHRHLNVDGEEKFSGKGVSYCATCDGYFFKGKDVALVGGGNTAITYALFMTGIASKVYLIHRRDEFRAEPFVVEQLLKQPNVVLKLNSVVTKIDGSDFVERVHVKEVKSGKEEVIPVSAVFIAVGEEPNNELAKKLGLTLNEKGNIQVNERQETSIPGVYAAGDVTGKGWAQAVNAAAQGMTAGIECSLYVKKLRGKII